MATEMKVSISTLTEATLGKQGVLAKVMRLFDEIVCTEIKMTV